MSDDDPQLLVYHIVRQFMTKRESARVSKALVDELRAAFFTAFSYLQDEVGERQVGAITMHSVEDTKELEVKITLKIHLMPEIAEDDGNKVVKIR